ncbi:MAG: hypothetical protein KC425_16590 [Anaerolineales bacterium]|nr:hypothetical protein [Anaerolineales bacterium]
MRIVNQVQRRISVLFVSQAIFEACQAARPWDTDRYLFVEIGDLLPAWVTADEQARLVQLTTFDQFGQFTDEIGLRPIASDDFLAWRDGKRPLRDPIVGPALERRA